MRIAESGVVFVVDDDKSCHLDALPKQRLAGVKTCELVTMLPWSGAEAVVFVEAKSSSPMPTNAADFKPWISDVSQKFQHAITLWVSHALGRHEGEATDAYFPAALRVTSTLRAQVVSVLVLPDHPDDALSDVRHAIKRELGGFLAAAGAERDVWVLNRRLAQRKGVISGS